MFLLPPLGDVLLYQKLSAPTYDRFKNQFEIAIILKLC